MTALQLRDDAWVNSKLIPSWVRGRDVSLDQHNTPNEISEYCWKSFQDILNKHLDNYKIIEPSAGTGSFYNLLPKETRIGVDIEKFNKYDEYIQSDFLTWHPFRTEHKYIAIGNPPFGYRGWLALSFLNHAAEFCDYVGFILPMGFQSEGKGSLKYRVKGMTLVHHEILRENLFIKHNGDKTSVNTLWQIWKKGEPMKKPDFSKCDEYLELFTVDQRKERLCGQEKMKGCKIFLQRTFYTDPPTLVNDFSKVKYCCGYGFIIKKDKRKIKPLLKQADWVKYSNLATHNCRHISMDHIKQYLLDNYIAK
jgi:predicted RNA methylase